MTLDAERIAIETFFEAQWADRLPWEPDGQPFTPAVGVARLTIQSGQRFQGSIGRIQNRIDNVGIVTVSIFTDPQKGSSEWRPHADAVIDIFHDALIDTDGAQITQSADAFVRFSPVSDRGSNEQHPYVSASFKQTPHQITNVIAPFIRYEYR